MRVALNVEQLVHRPPGGVGRYTAELVRLLPDRDVDLVPFVALHARTAVERAFEDLELDPARIDPVILALPRPVLFDAWNVTDGPRLSLLHRRLRDVDLVHSPSLAVPPKGSGPVVVTVHDAAPLLHPETYTRRGRRFHEQGMRATARRADLVIAPSQAAAEEIAARTDISSDRLRVVHQGVDQVIADDEHVRAARATHGIGDVPYVLWVGTLEPRKNVGVLLEAFDAVVDAGLPHRLVLVGSKGWLDTADEIRKPVRALGDRVRVTDRVSNRELRALYRGADVVAQPSLHEGFGLPVLEAMAQGTAVVCSDIAVLREVAGDAGTYVDACAVDAWGDALLAMLRDDAKRERLAAAGRERAKSFTWERTADRTRAIYAELC